tara:strand:+ start:14 stop:136 length:123 start_codon:yes stop_codon:yes gene_type:complete
MTTIIKFIPDEKAFAKRYAEFLAKQQREADTISGDLMRDD